ncbi:MAG TPA: oxalurate catabolism protein HpxZ [Halothiobacillus sp.]|nr:MAG: hypothetical protein B7Z82_01935 [Halothiobacillus sp. 20-54-6]HQT42528.1 oxalurate catabolism protein HpxZ [Halothiobacillus sp.]
MKEPNIINIKEIVNEVRHVFAEYEQALVHNDLEILDRFFWHTDLVVRFGANENLYGIDAIRAFRHARPAAALKRCLINTKINTFGTDFATTTTEFIRPNQPMGRQTQAWVRFADGWRIVSAHVSTIHITSVPNQSISKTENGSLEDDWQSPGG